MRDCDLVAQAGHSIRDPVAKRPAKCGIATNTGIACYYLLLFVAKRPAKCGIATRPGEAGGRQLPPLQRGLLNAGLRRKPVSCTSTTTTFLVAKRPAKCGIATI